MTLAAFRNWAIPTPSKHKHLDNDSPLVLLLLGQAGHANADIWLIWLREIKQKSHVMFITKIHCCKNTSFFPPFLGVPHFLKEYPMLNPVPSCAGTLKAVLKLCSQVEIVDFS